MKIPRSAAALAVVLALALAGCTPRGNSATAAGSTAFLPFAEKLAEEFMRRNPGFSIAVQGGGSAVGIQAALSGAAQIGMADLVELPEEARSLNAVVVALDAIAVVVHPSNPVEGLSSEQVRAVFGGRIRSWSEVGGRKEPITVVSREAGSGTRSSFEKSLGGLRLTDAAIIQDSNGTIRETVGSDPRAIGYLSLGVVDSRVKALSLDGVPPTVEQAQAGRYALVRPVYLLTRGQPAEAARKFIEYALGPEGQRIIREDGLIAAP